MDRKTISILAILSILLLFGLTFFAFSEPSYLEIVADQFRDRMDQNVDPCDDFYQFSCGGFLNSDDDKYDTSTVKYATMIYELKKILEKKYSVNEPKYLELAKNFYHACNSLLKNTKTDKKLSSISNLIKKDESWPILKQNPWNESEFNFNKTIFQVGNTTEWINYFFEFNLNIDDYSSIEISPISYKLTSNQLNQGLSNSEVKKYYDKMIKLSASSYTDASSNITIVEMINEILKFETDIFNTTLLPENEPSNDATGDVKMTLDELKNNYSYFDWEGYINYHRDTPVNSTTTKIIIKDIKYLKNLKYLLNSTEKIIQSNYITWKHFQKKFEIFELENSNDCVRYTIKALPIAMGAIYYQNHRDSSIGDVLQINMDIKKQFSDMINNSNWVDDMTKKKAIEKLDKLKYFITYPKEFLNNLIIDEFYGGLTFFDSDNYFDQSTRINKFNQQYLLTLNNENFWAYWGSLMVEFNAFNIQQKNIIVITPVYRDVYFNKKNLNSMNYGTIGFTIGHETGHAFDNTGILYDANGIENDWWRNDSLQNFKDRAGCMVKQYDSYKLPEINATLNGTLTLGENIADNSGIKAAYRGFIEKLKSSNKDETLPGLSYNSKQLFWISYAHYWCQKVTNKSLERALLNEHVPDKYRVIGTLSNIQEFSNDFQCPIGSKMNPKNKCTFW